MWQDADDAYAQLRSAGVTKEEKLQNLDVLLHTFGGDPTGAYRLGQALRLLANGLEFLVPEYAFSAGSLLCLSGDCIWLGDNAGLSPFDITLRERTVPALEVPLASVDNFVEFATAARGKIEELLQAVGSQHTTTLDSDLLCEMVKQVGALKIGEYFRERLLTANYAQVLLDSYMFRGQPNAADRRRDVIEKMVHRSPSHQYFMDFHIARAASLTVRQLDTQTSDLAKRVVAHLDDLTAQGVICLNLADEYKMPFIRFYETSVTDQGDGDGYSATQEEAEQPSDGHVEGTLRDVQAETRPSQAGRWPNAQRGSRKSE
jgi:hypothetical protein